MPWYLITSYEIKNTTILNVKGVDFRCVLWGISSVRLLIGWINLMIIQFRLKLDRFYCTGVMN